MSFIYSMADTWNAVGTTFNGIYMNISNGAGGAPVGAAASRAFRLDANSTAIFGINISGLVYAGAGAKGTPTYSFLAETNTGIYQRASSRITFTVLNNDRLELQQTALNMASDTALQWASGEASAGGDLVLARDAANTLAQRNGTTGQALRIYNTFTDASNYELFQLGWAANVCTLGNAALGTGSNRTLQILTPGPLTFATSGGDDITFKTTNASRWFFRTATGNLDTASDGSSDIGLNGKPNNCYLFGYLKPTTRTIASLPTPASAGSGAQMFVSDALTPVALVTVASGGARNVPVYSDGTNWLVG